MEEVNLIERASQIHQQTKKRSAPVEPHIAALPGSLYSRALEDTDIAPLNRLSNLLDRFSLISMDQLAADMEAAAETAQEQDQVYPLAIKALWGLAAYAHAQAKRPDEQRRCQLAGVDQTLRMALQAGSASGAAYWHRQAIGELRQITGTEERREELRREIRVLQDKALGEMGTFETPVDLFDMVSATTEECNTAPVGLDILNVQPAREFFCFRALAIHLAGPPGLKRHTSIQLYPIRRITKNMPSCDDHKRKQTRP